MGCVCGSSGAGDSNGGSNATAGKGGSNASTGSQKKDSQKKLLDYYNVGEMLGQGAFGIVYACRKIGDTGEKDLAVKMVDKAETPPDKIKEEYEMLQRLKHDNCIKCEDVIIEKCFVCIVMARLRGGDLIVGMQAHWKSKGKIPVMSTVNVTAQMAQSIAYLHSIKVIHRDVKGDNYLCDRADIVHPQIKIVLTDFGTAVDCDENKRLHEKCGTKLYWSPEFHKLNYGHKVDVWAMGVIIYGLINGKFPFRDEKDVNGKEATVPKGTPKECSDFVQQVLAKKEDSRLSSADVLTHAWISTKVSHEGGGEEDKDWKAEIVKDDGAAAGVGERRNEIVERMQEGKAAKANQNKKGGEEHYWKEWFSIVDRHAKNSTLRYEWWAKKKIEEDGILSLDGANTKSVNAMKDSGNINEVKAQLQSHDVNTSQWGTGGAKRLDQLAHEVDTGACTLLLDASKHKALVRVVDVVLLRINAPNNKSKIFVETGEKFEDGRTRTSTRLPGTKKEPHMNSKQVAEKIVAESMDLKDGSTIKFDFNLKETFEETEMSPSFPGLTTVYRKEIITGELRASTKKPEDGLGKERKDKANLTKYFEWMTTAQLDKDKITYKTPQEGDEVSGLVQAPIGMTEEQLETYLKAYLTEEQLKKFGVGQAKTLKDISAELMRGESTLMLEQDGKLIRVVDVVVIKLVHSISGSVLVQTKQTLPDGVETQLKRLPGAKRRPDENQFLTARRILKRQLKIEENHVTLDAQNVQVAEEIKESLAYPGLRTTYRKRIITATLAKPGDLS